MTGSITASCGHTLAGHEETETVRYKSETCDAVEGFVPCVVYAEYCPACAHQARSWPEFLPGDAAADAWLDGNH